MPAPVDVSFIITVYNKEHALPSTIRSLLMQRNGNELAIEYIFVDDASTDNSVAVIEQNLQGIEDAVIIGNTVNLGPSIRLNQGIRLARGKYLQFLDADDILAQNSTKVMFDALQKSGAEVIYGEWQRSKLSGRELLSKTLPDTTKYRVSDKPLLFILNGVYTRMVQMVSRELCLRAEGADERVFIQDESLPLRLCVYAKRFAELKGVIVYVPQSDGHLSDNVSQRNHDRFLANYYLLKDHPELNAVVIEKLFNRCVSAAWKQARTLGIKGYATPAFTLYLRSKLHLLSPDKKLLDALYEQFLVVPGVRHVR